MKLLRQTAAAVSVSALAVLGLQMSAGAAVPSISASDTTIPAGGSVNVSLGEPGLADDPARIEAALRTVQAADFVAARLAPPAPEPPPAP